MMADNVGQIAIPCDPFAHEINLFCYKVKVLESRLERKNNLLKQSDIFYSSVMFFWGIHFTVINVSLDPVK